MNAKVTNAILTTTYAVAAVAVAMDILLQYAAAYCEC